MTRRTVVCVLTVLALALSACGDDDGSAEAESSDTAASEEASPTSTPDREVGQRIEGSSEDPAVALEVIATEVRAPTTLAFAPGDDRIFVLESVHGQIRIIQDGELLSEPFLDIADRL